MRDGGKYEGVRRGEGVRAKGEVGSEGGMEG